MAFSDFYLLGLSLQPTVYGITCVERRESWISSAKGGSNEGFLGVSVCVVGGGGGGLVRTAQRRLLNHICNRYTNVPVYSLTPPVYI